MGFFFFFYNLTVITTEFMNDRVTSVNQVKDYSLLPNNIFKQQLHHHPLLAVCSATD